MTRLRGRFRSDVENRLRGEKFRTLARNRFGRASGAAQRPPRALQSARAGSILTAGPAGVRGCMMTRLRYGADFAIALWFTAASRWC